MAIPSGTVTFLFSDIEGSTRRWQDEPEAMRAWLVEHDAIWREVIEKHRGHLFKHTGDGVAAVFSSASDAVDAAVDAKARLAEVLPVRMGLHTGEAELRDGDYFGSTLNRCARLMGIAHGGQVVCSAATVELVRDRDDLRDLGEHRLRDLSRAERVWQIGGGEFPALRSLTAASTNLPSLGNAFIGRVAELDAVAKELSEARLVTLTGVGGVGKTRLAMQVAAEALPRFVDGVWLCELAAAANADEMMPVVALALGVVQRPQMTLTESIVDFLRPRQTLIVLDNCEHLLDAAAELVEDVLAGAPGVRVLATSREGFGIADERVRPLRSLAIAAEHTETSDAVVLFVERARAVNPDFTLDAASAPVVADLCRRLDGIPLAIELAAARVTAMSPAEMVSHLDERFRLLTGGRRGRVERHQTLRAAVEWSYSLLGEVERSVFDCIGVFPSSFDEAAAVAVCADDGVERWDVIDALAALVAKSMIGTERDSGTTRYQLLETLRHFARDRAHDLDALRRRHATYYATFAEQLGAGLRTPDELVWRPRLGVEIDNLRAATAWAFDAATLEEVVIGARIVDALVYDGGTASASFGIQRWAAPVLDRVDGFEPRHRAALCAAAGVEAFQAGDIEGGRALARRAIADSVSLTPACAAAVAWLAGWEAVLGNDAALAAVLADAHRLLDAVDVGRDYWAAALATVEALAPGLAGTFDGAVAENAVALARRSGVPNLLFSALGALGRVNFNADPDVALAAYDEASALFDAGAASGLFTMMQQDTAVLRAATGDHIGAARAARAAIEHGARNGDRINVVDTLAIASFVAAVRRDLAVSATLVGARNGPALGAIRPGSVSIHVPLIEAALARVAAELATVAYAAAYQRGGAMSYDEIVAYALEELGRMASEPASRG